MVFHAFGLLCVRSIEVVMPSHLSFFYSAISSISLFPAYMVPSPNGLHRYCSWYASYNVFDSSVRPGIWYMLSGRHKYDCDKLLVAFWCGIYFINILVELCCISQPFSFPQIEASSKGSGLWYNNWFYCNTYWTVLGMWYWIENRFLTDVSDAYRSKDKVKVISLLPSHTIK